MKAADGFTTLAIFLLATVLATLTFTMVEEWSATWEAWLAAAPPDGAGFSGDRLAYLEKLPTALVAAQIAVVLASALPFAIRVGR